MLLKCGAAVSRGASLARPTVLHEMTELRGRGWRRSKSRVKGKRTGDRKPRWIPERNLNHMYTRSEKLRRARQLKMDYPIRHVRQTLDGDVPLQSKQVTNLLFICSRNQWRSPTAEALWRQRPGFSARSAGTSPQARKTVSAADVQWADLIFVMEKKHKIRLQAEFGRACQFKTIHVLDIPDEYRFMDPDLIDELEARVGILLST